MRLALLVAVIAVAALFGATCGGDEDKDESALVIKSTDQLRFEPAAMTVKVGETVKIRLDNSQGKTLHDFSIDRLPTSESSVGESSEHADHGPPMVVGTPSAPQLHIAAEAGKSASLEFVPTQPGRYAFYCGVTGHREGGMEGVIVVEA
jgi:uncharacterized cupredoxin-like copper-binding protein